MSRVDRAKLRYARIKIRDSILTFLLRVGVLVGFFVYYSYTSKYWVVHPAVQFLVDAGVAVCGVFLLYWLFAGVGDRIYLAETMSPKLMMEAAIKGGGNMFFDGKDIYCDFPNTIIHEIPKADDEPSTYFVCHRNLIGQKTWFLFVLKEAE